MTREDVLKIMPNATDEQITQFLNAHHGELTAEKDKAKGLKATNDELAKAKAEVERLSKLAEDKPDDSDLQAQIDALTKSNEEAKQTIKNMELKANLLGKGFGADDVDLYIKTLNEGGDIADVLGKMKDNAISAHDKARMEKTPDPKGSGSTPPDTKDRAERLAESVFSTSSNNKNILENYKK